MNKRAHEGHGRHAAGRGAGDWQDESEDLHTREPAIAWPDGPAHHRDVGKGDGHHAPRHGDDDTDLGGLTVLIGGFAAAGGEQSLATGMVECVTVDRGGVSIASGEAVFDAYGYAEQPGEAFAAAGTYLQITGADLVLQWESEASSFSAGQAWAHSEVDYLAIDIDAWSPAQPIVIELDHAFALQPRCLDAGPTAVAAVMAAVEVHGVDTLSLTSTYAFTDDQFSFVQAMALASL
ncbi:MAG TPA: hypothetical protein VE527_16800 [Reyranella sp.]|jgi:hypothetical protein|nr:hypothetical protein [Reyranella sp.]